MLTGENGLLTKAGDARIKNEEGEIKEEIALAWNSVQTDGIVNNLSLSDKAGLLKTELEKNGNTATVAVSGSSLNVTYRGYKATINPTGGGITSFAKETPTDPPDEPTTVAEAKTAGKVFDGTEDPIVDDYGNEVIVPKGFKIVEGTNVTDGIVIEDVNANGANSSTTGSQFVWIPVGKIYTDAEKTEANAKTIELGRYCFEDSEGNPTGVKVSVADDEVYSLYCQEETTARINEAGKNATAKNLSGFLSGATKGFYIERYEARVQGYTSVSTSNSENLESWTGYVGGTLVSKKDAQVYNWITQNKAAEVSRAMYSNLGKFESDLINSYAWDTAVLFLQEFGEANYSIKSSVNNSLANKGTSASDYSDTRDVVCNVYDMASNCYEWTTETCSDSDLPCVGRGGSCGSLNYTSWRDVDNASVANGGFSFRSVLYVK